ncbi:heme-binding protein [uncultured Pseudoteredinibacter sp.]|uniref:heme-binding protein n=1 Tax=uncultured Pseudoteredinibacter sp. TaxID=1641701 RepID=UPI00262E87C2|nr:heme-binding protein [uncultured Pseudoteredinibacter sp.]
MRLSRKGFSLKPCLLLATSISLLSCGGGGGGSGTAPNEGTPTPPPPPPPVVCEGNCTNADSFLRTADVEKVVQQAVAEAKALGVAATIAVVDRVGNVLAVYRTADIDTSKSLLISSNKQGLSDIDGGLENIQLPLAVGGDALAAISKAITGAYLSTEGNAFSSRVASQIVQEHFNPGERVQPAGPLFGVQFSQLACSDFTLDNSVAGIGPKQAPLGLSADPGGFPLYKDNVPVGGVGVISDDFIYTLDKVVVDSDMDQDELIALAATVGFEAPADRRADRITVDGKVLRYTDVEYSQLTAAPGAASTLNDSDGQYIPVPDYIDGNVRAGQAFGQASSGIRADTTTYPNREAYVFVDAAGQDRFPPTDGTELTADEVQAIIDEALGVANQSRAQIRRPLSTKARVTISVVDLNGDVLGMARTLDAPVFGADVSLQKARTAAFFSNPAAADFLQNLPLTQYLNSDLSPKRNIDIANYVQALRDFVEDSSALSNGIAFSDRAGGNLSRPFYPDGVDNAPHGPLSKPAGEWSPFSTGLQLDLTMNGIVSHLLHVAGLQTDDVGNNCVGVPFGGTASSAANNIANGIQIFPGSVPIYKGNTLVGGIGISGDGVDQDDMIAFLGVHRAAEKMNGSFNNAPAEIRADTLTPQGTRLRYISCPQSPFIDSDEQNVCSGK